MGYGDYGSQNNATPNGGDSYISQTQSRRSQERFNILDIIRGQQAAINAQNMKYGRVSGGGHGPYPDFVLNYFQDSGGGVSRDSVSLGTDTRSGGRVQFLLDDLFTQGNHKKLLNIDLGFEAFLDQTTNFAPNVAAGQTTHSYQKTGGGLLIRPFGRSSQDTGLLVKGGYMNMTESGLWTNTQTQFGLYAPYLGAEARLYLLNFLGINGDYLVGLETNADALQGKWKMQSFRYGAFLEIYFISLGAYFVWTEMDLSPYSGSSPIKEVLNGYGFSATLFF